jgi:hypothetical protein
MMCEEVDIYTFAFMANNESSSQSPLSSCCGDLKWAKRNVIITSVSFGREQEAANRSGVQGDM